LRTAFASSPVSWASQATVAAMPRARSRFTVGAFHQQLQVVEVSHESSRVLMWCRSSLAAWLGTLSLRWKRSEGEVATGDRSRNSSLGVRRRARTRARWR
jgi:hypothetical protein